MNLKYALVLVVPLRNVAIEKIAPEKAKKMMNTYSAFQEEAETALQSIFRKHF